MVIGIGNLELKKDDETQLCRDVYAAVRSGVLRMGDARRIEKILQAAYLREAGDKPGIALERFERSQGNG